MSKIEVDEIVNQTGDNDSGIDLSTNDVVAVKTANTQRMIVDASGNVGINTTNASSGRLLHIEDGGTACGITLKDTAGSQFGITSDGNSLVIKSDTGSLDRMDIDALKATITSPAASNNALIVHNTAGSSPYGIQIDNDLDINNGSNWFIHAIGNTTSRFKVFTNGNVVNTNNSYGSISDEKLKENIVDSGSQWNDIKALKVRKYSLKEDKLDAPNKLGVIAQELETANMNGLVLDTPDVDKYLKDLGTVTKTVNYSILYMKAVKALQEAMTRIETLEAKVTALESK